MQVDFSLHRFIRINRDGWQLRSDIFFRVPGCGQRTVNKNKAQAVSACALSLGFRRTSGTEARTVFVTAVPADPLVEFHPKEHVNVCPGLSGEFAVMVESAGDPGAGASISVKRPGFPPAIRSISTAFCSAAKFSSFFILLRCPRLLYINSDCFIADMYLYAAAGKDGSDFVNLP